MLDRIELLLRRLEVLLPPLDQSPDWRAHAFRWRKKDVLGSRVGWLEAVAAPHRIRLEDLQHIEPQKAEMVRNTRQFAAGRSANNVLLTGARGTGKSSLVKAVWHELEQAGLRLIEVDKADLVDLPELVALLAGRPERFIVFCDDLSFEEGDAGYKALKSVLDGSVVAAPDNVLVYATSNRRHLMPEYFDDNARTRHQDGEIHPHEAVEEKISLSERFGLWLTFYAFDQDAYLAAARHWLAEFGCPAWNPEIERAALNWALARGARSGRVAWQFARDRAGREA
ncbi:ATP-binding protein [Chitinimonas lacunae]|uniref:ATP-binding protein n=1 Tax=Chitinimonas lacunae TaxID=1963018 RepID=A0ABV8MNE0_9NEIS